MLAFIPPMMPELVDEPPEGDGWQHEIKFDGYRTQLLVESGGARAITRRGHDWSEKYRQIVKAAQALPCASAIIDGEVIIQDEQGRCDYHALRSALARRQPAPFVLMDVDLLHLEGRDWQRLGLKERERG